MLAGLVHGEDPLPGLWMAPCFEVLTPSKRQDGPSGLFYGGHNPTHEGLLHGPITCPPLMVMRFQTMSPGMVEQTHGLNHRVGRSLCLARTLVCHACFTFLDRDTSAVLQSCCCHPYIWAEETQSLRNLPKVTQQHGQVG